MSEQLQAFLDQQHMTQREAAARMNISEEHLSRVINGKTPVSPSFVGRFALCFGMDAAATVFDPEHDGEQAA